MAKVSRLRKREEIKRVYQEGKSYFNGLMVLYVYPNPGLRRVGFSLGRGLGDRCARNRVKRRIRAAYQNLERRLLPSYDLLIVPREEIKEAKFDQIGKELENLFQKANLLRQGREE